MSKSIVGIAKSTSQVEATLDDLQNDGAIPASDISLLMPDSAGTPELGAVKATKAPEGATTGAVTGGAIGGTVGLLAGVGALAIPGLGPFIAAGPIMAALSGAAFAPVCFNRIHHAFSEPCLHASSKGVVRKTSHPLFAWLQELAPRGMTP